MHITLVFTSSLLALSLIFGESVQGQETAEGLMKKGDVFYARLSPKEALKFYLPAEKLEPQNVGLLVRIARQYRHLVTESSDDTSKERYARTAIAYADRAVALAPNDPEAQLAAAVSHAKVLAFENISERLATSRVIKQAAEKTIQLDPKNDLGWQVLGRYYFAYADVSALKRALAQIKYGKLPAATFDDAARCFEKALALNPNRLMHYIELGRTYARLDRTQEARTLITKGLAMPEIEKDDPETKQLGRDVLKSL